MIAGHVEVLRTQISLQDISNLPSADATSNFQGIAPAGSGSFSSLNQV